MLLCRVAVGTCECAKVEGIEVWTERNTRDVLKTGVEDVEEWRRRLNVHLPYGCGNRGKCCWLQSALARSSFG
jgi:hypothetical protein